MLYPIMLNRDDFNQTRNRKKYLDLINAHFSFQASLVTRASQIYLVLQNASFSVPLCHRSFPLATVKERNNVNTSVLCYDQLAFCYVSDVTTNTPSPHSDYCYKKSK